MPEALLLVVRRNLAMRIAGKAQGQSRPCYAALSAGSEARAVSVPATHQNIENRKVEP